MAPERERRIAVMDLRYDDNELRGQVEYVEADYRLQVSFSKSQPEDYHPFPNGVAYYLIRKDKEAPIFVAPHDHTITRRDDSTFQWSEGGFSAGKPSMMMILILPKDYTLNDPQPAPIDAKTFDEDARLALYWIPLANSEGRAVVEWKLKPFEGDLGSEVQKIKQNHANVPTSSPVGVRSEFPPWFPIAGAVFGGITLLFLMLLIVLSLFTREIPKTSRFIVVAFIALSVGLSSTFLGGTAAAKGAVSLPFFRESPMSFAVSGGIAAFVIVLVLGYALYIM